MAFYALRFNKSKALIGLRFYSIARELIGRTDVLIFKSSHQQPILLRPRTCFLYTICFVFHRKLIIIGIK